MQESPLDQGRDRPFICPCSKSYLSYPALFTHIKQKHNGIPPGEIIRPKTNNKRGRPRKNFNDGTEEVSSQDDVSPPVKMQYKNPLDRFYNSNKNDDEQIQILIKQAQKIKSQNKTNFEFKAPITFTHSTSQPEREFKAPLELPREPKPNANLKKLSERVCEVFQNIQKQKHLGLKQMERLVEANVEFHEARREGRTLPRKPIGVNQWQLELKYGLIQFLNWCETFLDRYESKNMQILTGVVFLFYYEMLPLEQNITTINYVLYLNAFMTSLMDEVKNDGIYRRVFSLEKVPSTQLISLMHEWFLLQGLSFHDVKMNPYFREEATSEHSQ